MKPFFLNIDILGTCNLACPSCPQGNDDRAALPKGLMTLELFRAILDKAQLECRLTGVGLFNWTEPLLHPQVYLFIREVRSRNLPCHLSSNLNDVRNLSLAIRENPSTLRLSISGFTQPIYGRTHARGNIERVKENMGLLAQTIRNERLAVQVTVLWHQYQGNTAEEPLMRAYARQLGFGFDVCEAYLMPVEKVLTRWRQAIPALPIEDVLKTPLFNAKPVCEKYKHLPCRLQERELTIDAAGDVHLCCALYDPKLSRIGSFKAKSVAEIQQFKRTSPVCKQCLAAGGHAYATFLWKRKARWLCRLGNLRANWRSAGIWRWTVGVPVGVFGAACWFRVYRSAWTSEFGTPAQWLFLFLPLLALIGFLVGKIVMDTRLPGEAPTPKDPPTNN